MNLNPFETEYLRFCDLPAKPKTRVIGVSNHAGTILGEIRWLESWRQYVFFPEAECVFSKGCLEDINCVIKMITPVKHKC